MSSPTQSLTSNVVLYQDPIINQLYGEYSSGKKMGILRLSLDTTIDLCNTGFFGSENVVSLTANSMSHESPACIAAPLVIMTAINSIVLGSLGQGKQPDPVRVYAPQQLILTTNVLTVGDMNLLSEPKTAMITCKKMQLIQNGDEESKIAEMFKSWIINEDVEVKIVKSTT